MTTDYLAHALQKRIRSVSDNFARLSCTRECNRLLAFLTTSSMCAFQVRLVPIVSTSNLAVLTTSTSFLSITTASSSTGFQANEIRSSLLLVQ